MISQAKLMITAQNQNQRNISSLPPAVIPDLIFLQKAPQRWFFCLLILSNSGPSSQLSTHARYVWLSMCHGTFSPRCYMQKVHARSNAKSQCQHQSSIPLCAHGLGKSHCKAPTSLPQGYVGTLKSGCPKPTKIPTSWGIAYSCTSLVNPTL